jgi:hypothetical protein
MPIEFEEDGLYTKSFQSRAILGTPQTPGMVKYLVKMKVAKNEKSAGIMLLVISCIAAVVAVGIFVSTVSPQPSGKKLSPAEQQRITTDIQSRIRAQSRQPK